MSTTHRIGGLETTVFNLSNATCSGASSLQNKLTAFLPKDFVRWCYYVCQTAD
jgi:hypothetical protein